jgi:hypothetical protein
MHGARGGAPEGERNGNYRHGARIKEAIELTSSFEGWARGDVREDSQSSSLTEELQIFCMG